MYISHWKKTASQIHLFPPLSYTLPPPPPPHPLHLAIPLYPTKLSLLETEPRNLHACGFLVSIQTSCKRQSPHKHTQCMYDHMHTCRMRISMHAYTQTPAHMHTWVCASTTRCWLEPDHSQFQGHRSWWPSLDLANSSLHAGLFYHI